MNTKFTGFNLLLHTLNSYIVIFSLIFILFFITNKFELSYANNDSFNIKKGNKGFITKIKILLFKAHDDKDQNKSYFVKGILEKNPNIDLKELKNR
jgi:Ni,Fe-hydrogenase I cytochrome b subunit